MRKEVVITGLGIVSSIGFDKESFINALISGTSNVGEITLFDANRHRTQKAAQIKFLEKHPYFDPNISRDRTLVMAGAAAQQAIKDAKLDLDKDKNCLIGLWLGTTTGNIYCFEEIFSYYCRENFLDLKNLSVLKNISLGSLSKCIADYLGISGPMGVFPTVCASGTHAIAMGAFFIRTGMAEVMLVGGADALNDMLFAGFNSLRVMAPEMCSPFSIDREGLILGEGSGILVLEEKERALARGVQIYAKVDGFGISCDAKHIATPDPESAGAALAMQYALDDAALTPQDIDYINAHGTGTVLNDTMETLAIKKVFGKVAYRIPISSIKAMIGHAMGVAGALEAIACILTMKKGKIPPTINYKGKDPNCDLDYVPNVAREKEMKKVLSNSFGFGGNNACIILGRHE